MKTALTIILFILLNGCLGQYPQLHYLPKMTVVKDSGSHWFSKPGNDTIFVTLKTYIGDSLVYFVAPYVDTLYSYKYWDSILNNHVTTHVQLEIDTVPNIYEHDSTLPNIRVLDLSREDVQFENFNEGFQYVAEGQNPDTVYFYWKKYLFYSHQSDKQKDIIKKQRNPSYKEYDRLMDSVLRYKKLIDGLKKQSYE